MTDDFSKVVKFLLGEGELRGAWFGDEPPGALGPMPRFWWRKDLSAAFARLESAATPAEVDGVVARLAALMPELEFARETHVQWSSTSDASLARNPDIGSREFHRQCITEYDERIGAVKQASETIATLARQLAEAKERGDNLDTMATYWHEANRQAESQLAEATRRLGEVEGLVGKWRHNAQGCGRKDAHAAGTWRSCARELEAALQKGPG